MVRQHVRLGIIGGAAAALAACGGGVSSTPTPPPAPPPAPVAAFPMATSQSFQTIAGTTAHTGQFTDGLAAPSTGNPTLLSATARSAAPTFTFDAAAGSYTLQAPTFQVTLTAANRIAATGYAHTFRATTATTGDDVTLYGNAVNPAPAAAAPVALTYASYGFWKHSDSASGLTTQTYFLYGAPTTSDSQPRTGSATYQGLATGHLLSSGPATPATRAIGGTAGLSADFGAGTVTTTLSLGSDGTYQGSGRIAADQFSGTFTATTAPYASFDSGSFFGGFFGPAASEFGYTFMLRYLNPDPYAGASPAPQNIWLSGVVVGRKN